MTTALDSSLLFDLLTADPEFGEQSRLALKTARNLGQIIVCPVVWAEIAAHFPDAASMRAQMHALEIAFDPFDAPMSESAGRLWKSYRRAGGKRERVLADFFVGAHAMARGGRLLSRDSGFYRRYFRRLRVLA